MVLVTCRPDLATKWKAQGRIQQEAKQGHIQATENETTEKEKEDKDKQQNNSEEKEEAPQSTRFFCF